MSFAYIYIYTISHVLTFSRSHHYALIFLFHYFFLLPLCSRSHASHHCTRFSLLKAVSVYHYALTFFSVIITFFSQCQPLFFHSYTFFSSHYALIFFQLSSNFFSVLTSLFNNFFFIMLSLCSHASIFFIFSFFISVSGGDPYRYFIFATFPTSTSTFLNTYFF